MSTMLLIAVLGGVAEVPLHPVEQPQPIVGLTYTADSTVDVPTEERIVQPEVHHHHYDPCCCRLIDRIRARLCCEPCCPQPKRCCKPKPVKCCKPAPKPCCEPDPCCRRDRPRLRIRRTLEIDRY